VVAVNGAPAAPGVRALVEARRFVGVAEHPPGSNRTAFGRWFGADGEPWCAIFLSYCFKVGAGIVLCGGTGGIGVNANGCAYVPTLERWLRDTEQWRESVPAPGDIVIFNWDGGAADHAGIVDHVPGDGRFGSIEGNSSGRVARRDHALADAVGFGRVRAYLAAAEGGYT
jgi:hypothetical protein